MTSQEETAQTLKDAGRRLTPQRLMILSAVKNAGGHLTASEILELVKESYPFMDASTVYRTLDVLKQLRLISETHMGGGKSTYEWREQEPHHHLVCQGCEGLTLLDDRFLETLRGEVLEAYGFEADIDHIALFGLCRECRDGKRPGKAGRS